MNLTDILNKIKTPSGDSYWLLVAFLVGISGFGLGRISLLEESRPAISVELPAAKQSAEASKLTSEMFASVYGVSDDHLALEKTAPLPVSGDNDNVYASKQGRRYYYSWCKSQVKKENVVWFENADQAKAKGLTLASGCREPF